MCTRGGVSASSWAGCVVVGGGPVRARPARGGGAVRAGGRPGGHGLPGLRRAFDTRFKAVGGAGRGGVVSSSCVEVADLRATRGRVGVRDSKDVSGSALAVTPAGWTAFVVFRTHSVRDCGFRPRGSRGEGSPYRSGEGPLSWPVCGPSVVRTRGGGW
ncbi:DUF397 domain-containing protein [Streptomyces sp. NPDC087420]|uniref:DUF397 domain-containing protein n=1 Tax=Streptomyces sp. NPDC087420 TaxID=3365785 RepID=UPI003838281B